MHERVKTTKFMYVLKRYVSTKFNCHFVPVNFVMTYSGNFSKIKLFVISAFPLQRIVPFNRAALKEQVNKIVGYGK